MPHRDKSVAIKQAITYQSQIKGDNLQPVYQNRKQLFSCSKQWGVTPIN